MAETIDRLYRLTVDGTAAARQLGEIERTTANLDKRLASSADALKRFGGILAAAFSAGAVVSAIQRNIDAMDELSKAVAKVGIGAEDLQRLRYAADLSGVSAEALDKAIGRLAVGMDDLKDRTTDAGKALAAIGAKSGEGPVETLKRISDQFQKMPDGIQKTALAIQLFGKSVGPDMIPLLNAGGDALQALADEADRFGGVLSGGTLQAAEAFNDNMSRLARVTAGIGAQISAGLLPALVAITNDLTDATRSGDGFVSTGNRIGEMLLDVYGIGLKASATLQAFGLVLAGLAAAASNPLQAKTIVGLMIDDVNRLGDETNARLAKLAENFKKVQDSTAGAGERAKIGNNFDVPKIESAAEATRKLAEANKKYWDEVHANAKALEKENEGFVAIARTLTTAEQNALAYIKATMDLNKTMDEQFEKSQAEAQQLQVLVEWMESGTEAQKAFAMAQLAATRATNVTSETISKQRDEIDVLTEGYEGFFDNLARGTADIEQLFKRMVQSILAELLKLWAKKYIIDAIFGATTGGAKAGATGFAFDASGAIPFARGGVISSPITFPMALAGEAGPEAILPLKRTASGDLGVQAQAAQMKVTINNYADASVTTRQTGPNEMLVVIEAARQAIAADMRNGGNIVSRSFEQAYGIGRGAAAAF